MSAVAREVLWMVKATVVVGLLLFGLGVAIVAVRHAMERIWGDVR